ncbi:MAG: hypothetical protein WAO91_02870 [Candidatus Nitrosotenuis sp.]
MGIFDLFKKPSKKEQLRNRIARNRENGRRFEDQQDGYHRMAGRKVEKLRKGPDRRITEENPFTGEKKVWYEEYKSSSTAPLRPSQKKFLKKHPRTTKIVRPNDSFELGGTGFDTDYLKKSNKKSNYDVDSMFGFNTKPSKTKSNGLDDMFGLGSSTKRKKSSGLDDMFGF